MTWTNPKTWVANTVLPASELNTYVRDNTNYLYDVGLRAETWINQGTSTAQTSQRVESGTLSITSGEFDFGSTTVTYDSEFGTAPRVVASCATDSWFAVPHTVGTANFILNMRRVPRSAGFTTGTDIMATVIANWIAIGA